MPTTLDDRDRLLALAGIFAALAVGIASLRMEDEWSDGLQLALTAVAAVVLLGGALRPRVSADPTPVGSSVLLLAGLAVFALADFRFLDIVRDGSPFEGAFSLVAYFALLTAVAAAGAARTRSAAGLLVAALAAGGCVLAAVHWIFDTENVDSYRPVLLVLAVVYAGAAYAFRGPQRHRDVLVDASGLALFGLAYISGAVVLFSFAEEALAWPWQAVLLVGGLAMAIYSAHQSAPGPGVLALVLLSGFAYSAAFGEEALISFDGEESDDNSIVGWPLALAVLAAASATAALVRGRRA